MIEKDRYNKCLKDLFGLRRFGIKLGLDTILKLLEGLGNPQDRFSIVHVAGTNGKGSIASSITSILHAAGYRVGLFTSPHLVKFNERIQINKNLISDEEVIRAYEAVKNVNSGAREPTFFEYSTAMALYEFAEQKVEWAVMETGMGGRLDATNAISTNLTIISNISLEHKSYLGNTLSEIAREKAGIIKPGIPLVTGVKQKSAFDVIRQIAERNDAPVYRLGYEFKIQRKKEQASFSYRGIDSFWPNLKLGLRGNHQYENAALGLAACEVLNRNGLSISLDQIRQGLLDTRWPGRLEIVSTMPTVILDGAHNMMAARNLAKYLSEEFSGKKITLVIGILDDKPYKSMLKSLLPFCHRVILSKPKINRALEPEILFQVAKGMVNDCKIIKDVKEAVSYAIDSGDSDDAVCIAGSLYVVGEAKAAIADASQ